MTVLTHNLLVGAVVLGALRLLRRDLRRTPAGTGGALGARDLALKLGLSLVAIALASLLGMLLYRGSLFGVVQLLVWSAFLHVPLFLAGVGLLTRRHHHVFARGALVLGLCLGLIAVDALLIEPHWLVVTRVEIASPKLSDSVRVVILADIQTDRPGAYEARVLQEAQAQAPDLLLFAGDYIQLGRRSESYAAEMAALRELLLAADLHAPLGAYAIAGNVDRTGQWVDVFEGLPVTTIEATQRYDLGPLVLTGLSMADAFGISVTLPPEEAFHIVMGHSPNFSLAPVHGDLLIAGHTHGGQVQLPVIGPLLTLSVVPRRWASGITQIDAETTLIVSRGIGLERADAPRLRFLCRPELVVVDLLPE